MKRYAYSILASALLWLILPLAIFLRDGGASLGAAFQPAMFGLFLVVSALMHFFFAPATRDLHGWHFWIFPFFTVPAAFLCAWSVWLLADLIHGGWEHRDIPFYLWALVATVFSLLSPIGAVAYLIALANQWLVRKLTTGEQAGAARP